MINAETARRITNDFIEAQTHRLVDLYDAIDVQSRMGLPCLHWGNLNAVQKQILEDKNFVVEKVNRITYQISW